MAKKSAAASRKSGAVASTKKVAVKNLHVMPHIDEGWIIRSEGSTRPRSHHHTKKEAIEAGRALASRAAITLVIHGRDGRVLERNSFNRHPMPPPELRKVLYPTTLPRTASKDAIRKAVSEAISEGLGKEISDSKGGNTVRASGQARQARAISKRDSRH